MIKKNPDYEEIIKKFDNGRCLFPQCASAYTKDLPYTFNCPAVQICIETVDVTVSGDIKGDVNIKQATKCTASTTDPTKPPPKGNGTGDDTGDGKDNLPPPPKDPEKTKLTTNMKLIAGFAIGIGFLFLLLLILLLTKKKK